MHVLDLQAACTRILGGKADNIILAFGELTVECRPEHYLDIMQTLRDHAELHFETLIDLCGVDYSTYKNETCFPLKTTNASACACGQMMTICPSCPLWCRCITARIGMSAKRLICMALFSTNIPICAAF